MAELEEKKLVNYNRRVVKDVSDFYVVQDFKRIGANLGKSLEEYFRIVRKGQRRKRKILKQIEGFYKDYKGRKGKKVDKAKRGKKGKVQRTKIKDHKRSKMGLKEKSKKPRKMKVLMSIKQQ